jgi:hypothetical protein
MAKDLESVIAAHRDELATTLVDQLRKSQATHYRTLDAEKLRERADRLVAAFAAALAARPEVFVRYLGEIANERIDEGFFLNEMQTALNYLEEKTWQLVVETLPRETQIQHLSRVTATIGAAKDHLAQIYLQRKQRAEDRMIELEERLELLTSGTDSAPLTEDDFA